MDEISFAAPPERNKAPLFDVLTAHLPSTGCVLELASGTGQHVEHFAARTPHLSWQPSEPNPRQRRSIAARIAQAELINVHAPLDLDVCNPWPEALAALDVRAVITANLLHISPPEVGPALFSGAARVLKPGGLVAIYGPFHVAGRSTSPGNVAFDADLRQRNPAWGIRDVEAIQAMAAAAGFAELETVAMPANNLTLLWRRHLST
ncbi:MAG: DUF938 domain-containing protein [Pseudomonadota bacterium]